MELSAIRREYNQGGLRRKDLPSDPLILFERWLAQAIEAKLPDPTAMTVATVDETGQPFQRIVLLKEVGEKGFVFYTNLGSRKAQQLANNSQISLHMPWHALERQVHVTGSASRLSHIETLKYFAGRPTESKLAAWVSHQSQRISARQILEGQFAKMKQKFANGEIPLPDFWGGYLIKPKSIEFWQGGQYRLHDRFLYQQQDDQGWVIDRLAP